MKRVRRSIAKEIFPNLPVLLHLLELKKQLKNCGSVLDIGCGEISPLSYLEIPHVDGLDGHQPSLNNARLRKTHHKYIKGDVTKLAQQFKANSYDCCIALDLIEHVPKKMGYKLIADMEKVAHKRIILFTPNGFMTQYDEKNKLQEHLSGWTAKEMKKLGFKVIGVFGHNSLRGNMHLLKFRPKFLWGIVSELSNILYTKRHPENASAILCVKDLY